MEVTSFLFPHTHEIILISESRNDLTNAHDCLGLIYQGQYTLKLHAGLLHYSFFKTFNVPFIDLLLYQQCNCAIILPSTDM